MAPVVITPILTNIGIEDLVRKDFADLPVMQLIAKCESSFRQYDGGKVLQGAINPKDTGIFQINKEYHLAASQALGMDITTPEGNIAYARILYEKNGTEDWKWSKNCWATANDSK